MKLKVVIPVIDKTNGIVCAESIVMRDSSAGFTKEDIVIVDNTKDGLGDYFYGFEIHRDKDGHNMGVPRAWNIGARQVVDQGLDYLVILSSSMEFGIKLHTTWVEQMERFDGANCIECDGHSWHLIAFHRRAFELVGYFDENFYPGYFEAIDFGYRLRMLNMEGGWPRCWVNAMSRFVGRHTDLVLAPPLLRYYKEKWGGDKGEETYVLPFGDKPLGYFEDRSIPELAKKYELTNWY